MDENTEIIKIDPDSKYLILIEFSRAVDVVNYRETLFAMRKELERWWNSDERFLILASDDKVQMTLEKLNKEPNVASQ